MDVRLKLDPLGTLPSLANIGPCSTYDWPATAADVVRFSNAELRVIDVGERTDALREIPAYGFLSRMVEWITGARLPRPLADPRLESLRRFTSLVRFHCDCVEEADIVTVIDAGFSCGQVQGLLAYLGQRCRHAQERRAVVRSAWR